MSDITIQPYKREVQDGVELIIIRVQHGITMWVQHVFNLADAETIYRELGDLLGHGLTPTPPDPILETNATTVFLTSMHGKGHAFFSRLEGTPAVRVACVYRGFELRTANLPADWTQAVGVLMSFASRIDAMLDSQ